MIKCRLIKGTERIELAITLLGERYHLTKSRFNYHTGNYEREYCITTKEINKAMNKLINQMQELGEHILYYSTCEGRHPRLEQRLLDHGKWTL